MTKKLNVESITNDLAGSAFFPAKKPPSPTADIHPPEVGVPPPVPHGVPHTVPRPVPLTPKVKRPIRQRQPFDIYEDQYQRLKKIADAEKGFVNGRGMSQMVREAIDNYLRDDATLEK
jgi:hypothetical protein